MKIYLLFLSVLFVSTSSLFAQPANDDCVNAEPITLTTVNQNIGFSFTDAQVNNEVGCQSTSASNYVDIWYEFTMPVTGNLNIDGTFVWNQFAIYDACGGNEVTCFQASSIVTDLVQGNSYKLRVFRTEAQAGNGFQNFSIQAFEKPLNDECTDAETLSVTTSSTNVNFSIPGADINLEEGCSGTTPSNLLDLWYEFTMPVTGNLYINGTFSWNQFAIYDACGGNEVACFQTRSFVTDLVQGNSYKLRVFRTENQADNNSQSFSIQAFEKPLNDECTDAETLNVTTSSTNVSFSIPGADINLEEGCEGTTSSNLLDLWYEFTMPVTGNLYVEGDIVWNNFAIYDACGGNEVTCFQTRSLVTNLVQGNTYKLRVFRTESLATNGFQNFTVRAFEKPLNDECTDAETLNVTTSSTNVSFSIPGADINLEEGCEGSTSSDHLDLWYEFTMPVNGNIIIDGDISWNNFALYDTCGSNEINCFTTSGTIENLVSGNTYSLRVFRTLTNAFNLGFQSFSIQAFEVVPNDDCIDAENIDLTSGSVNLNFSISGANLNNEEGCEGTGTANYADVWYAFEMPFSGDLFIDGNISWNQFAIYDACGGNELYCFDNQNLIQALNPGDYVLRVFRTEALALNSNFQSFSIQAFENSTNCAGISIWDGVAWNNGLPDNTTKAIVNDDFLLSTEIEWCELEVADGTYTIDQNAKLILNETTRSLSVNSNGNLNVQGILDVAGSIENNGDLIFISNSNSTGQLDMMNPGATVSGDVQVQRYIPAKRAFRFLSSAVSGVSIADSWQQDTHITGTGGAANGFDPSGSNAPSMFSFDHSEANQANAWKAVTSTATLLEAGTPYRLMVRGDRTLDLLDPNANDLPANPVTLSATGSLAAGSLTTNGTDLPAMAQLGGQFSLIGNPYQAVVDATQLVFNGDVANNEIAFWDPNLSARGAFVVVDIASGAGTPNPSTSQANRYIMPGQAFLTVNNAIVTNPPSITFTESAKATEQTQNQVFSVEAYLNVRLYSAASWNANDFENDALGIRWSPNYTTVASDEDFGKLNNPGENFAVQNGTNLLTIDKRNLPTSEEVIPLFINNYEDEDYVIFNQHENLPEGANLFLEDNYLETTTLLENGEVYEFSVDATIPASMTNNRFSIRFDVGTLSQDGFLANRFRMYPNPVENQLNLQVSEAFLDASVLVEVYDVLGRRMLQKEVLFSGNTQQIDVSNLSAEMYILKMQHDGKAYSRKFIKK